MNRNGYSLFVICSLLLHLLLMLVMAFISFNDLFRPRFTPAKQEQEAVAIIEFEEPKAPEPQPEKTKIPFVPTEEFQTSPTVNPNAILESERNTSLKGLEKGTEPQAPLPQQTGDERTSLSYVEQPRSTQKQGQTSNSSDTQKQNKQQQEAEQKQSPPNKTTPKDSQAPNQRQQPPYPTPQELNKDGVPVLPKKSDPPKPQTTPSPRPTESTQQQQQQSSQSSSYSFQRQRSAIKGATPQEYGISSPEAKESDIGKYKSRVYRAIGSRWYLSVDKHSSLLAIGAVKVKFFIQANGVIRDAQIVEQSGRVDILETISKNAVTDSGPFEPFSETMKQQLGAGYWEDITFTIY